MTTSTSATSRRPSRPTSQQARHHARTCDALHIHPNTLYQRLDRVTEVLGPRWKEPDRALELQVALRLHRLLADHPR